MDYASGDAPTIKLGEMVEQYRARASNVKRPHSRTLLNLPDGRIVRGHTVQVNDGHITVTVPSLLPVNQECAVFFVIAVAEHTFTIVGTGHVVSCDGSDTDGYRANLRFVVSDRKSRITMEQLFGNQRSAQVQ
jgi:hypothetical protein